MKEFLKDKESHKVLAYLKDDDNCIYTTNVGSFRKFNSRIFDKQKLYNLFMVTESNLK